MSDAHDHLREDPAIGPLIDEYGELELEPAGDFFERFVVSIVNQVISTEAARTIRERLFEAFEVTPEALLAADEAALRDVGLSPQKVSAIRNVAAWFYEEDITRERFTRMDDAAAIEELTDIGGVGDWTAKMVLMFGLGRADVFPVEDLAVRRGMAMLYGGEGAGGGDAGGSELTRAEMRERAERWAPYRSVATLYVWQCYVDENSTVERIVA
ncbi:DNA-3-methyladenine glycosylase 2 family protein [Halobacteriales archaeon QS_4_69_34]|nr:MAG: DNA-3-methyladenine glycosylase 2 family protein [Halobacteriales archaeon QS_4_69_34]